ncbi:ChuX/HutX family heme-like substrate-binding protein [Leisingera sp. F5]|uniref:hemin-degrading factor n=1 Tax=Leisingera sp. F5 TaxID=1813816 RepID=UPI000B060165|nr:ChuX/HutX family heme-like substrate-binding protein [Leisingera sp. F5]
MTDTPMTPAAIRAARAEHSTLRDRDFADKFSIFEGQLVAAYAGEGVTRIKPAPDDIMPRLAALGEVMALTRNPSCVIEKVGIYDNYRSGQHAAMVLNDAIDLRLFPKHFVTAFAVERETDKGIRRSLQIFDAAGDAVHKVHLRDASDLAAWAQLVADLKLEDQSQTLAVEPRKPAEAPKGNPDKADALRAEWAKMTDTHQFLRLASKLKMNRLGAYRLAGKPLARALETGAVNAMLEAVRDQGVEVMIFVGNMGCIEIHGGPVKSLREMGPWQNILDPGFDLHLRLDHIAEVWAVTKPTQRGDAVSVEAFDTEGGLILQVFGHRTEARDHRPEWNGIVEGLASLAAAEMA